MTLPSPLININGQSQLPNGINVAGGSTVTLALASAAGVYAWNIKCIGTDDLSSAAAVNASLVVNAANYTATFTMPNPVDGYGAAVIFSSQVNSGIDINGIQQPYLTTTAGIYVLVDTGLRVGAQNETVEGNAVFGWLTKLNSIIRIGGFIAGGDLSGTNINQTVIGLQTRPILSTAPTTNQILEWNGSAWAPTNLPSALPPDGPAGGDLYGTYPNPQVGGLRNVPIQNQTLTVLQDGYVLTWSHSLDEWYAGPQTGGGGGGGGSVIWSEDLIGSSNTQQWVAALSGVGGGGANIGINAGALVWASDVGSPFIGQTGTSIGDATSLSIVAQSTSAADGNGGNISITSGQGGSGGGNGYISLTTPGNSSITISDSPGSIQFSISNGNSFHIIPNTNLEFHTYQQTGSGVGQGMAFFAGPATVSGNNGGNISLTSGAGDGSGSAGSVSMNVPAGASIVVAGDDCYLNGSTFVTNLAGSGVGQVGVDNSGNLYWVPGSSGGTAGGDLSGVYPNPQVVGIRGISVPSPSGTNSALTYNAGTYSWEPYPTAVTWAGDLVGSTNSAQYVETITGVGGGVDVFATTMTFTANTPSIVGSDASNMTIHSGFSLILEASGPISGYGGNIVLEPAQGSGAGKSAGSVEIYLAEGLSSATNGMFQIFDPIDSATLLFQVSHTSTSIPPLGGSGSGIVAVDNGGNLFFSSGAPPSGSAGGDLSGTYPNPTVVQAQGGDIIFTSSAIEFAASVSSPELFQLSTSSGNAHNLTVAAQSTTADGYNGGNLYLSSGLAAMGTDGYVALQVGGIDQFQVGLGNITIPNYLGSTAGVVHNSSAGVLSSSLIVNADVASGAGIAANKLAPGGAAQFLLSNSTPTATWTTMSGDVQLSSTGGTTVVGIDGYLIHGTATVGQFLALNGSSELVWTTPTSGITWANDLAGSTNTAQYVAAISGNAGGGGTIDFNASTLLGNGNLTIQTPSNDVLTLNAAGGSGEMLLQINGSSVITLGLHGSPNNVGLPNMTSTKYLYTDSNGTIQAGTPGGDLGTNALSSALVLGLYGNPFESNMSDPAQGSFIVQNPLGSETGFWSSVSFTGDVSFSYSGLTAGSIEVTGWLNQPLDTGTMTSPSDGALAQFYSSKWRGITLSGDIGIADGGATTLNNIQGIEVNPTMASATNGQIIVNNGSKWTNTTASGDATINASGVITVSGINGNPVSGTGATAGQFLVENASSTGSAWTTLSGDVTNSVSTPGSLTVVALQGNAVHAQSLGAGQDGYVLTWHNASSYWEALPPTGGGGGNVTWTEDLAFSNNANQYVSALSYDGSGAGGSIAINGSTTSLQWSSVGAIGIYQIAAASTSSGSGSNGFTATILSQAGQAATGASHNGGNGGDLILSTGAGGTSGSATPGSAGNLLLQTGGTTGIKIDGSQNVFIPNFNTAGVVHNAVTTGQLSSSLIVNADVSSSAAIAYSKLNLTGDVVNADISTSAAIAVSKLAAGTSAQILLNNSTPTPTWTTVSGDVSITNAGVTTVTALQGNAVASTAPTNNYVLTWNSGASQWQPAAASGGISALTGDVTASGTGSVAATVVALQGNAVESQVLGTAQDGYVLAWVNASSQWQAKPVDPGLEVRTVTASYQINGATGTADDYHILCNNTSGITLTLPKPASGATFEIWDIKGTAETNNITLAPYSTEKISGIAGNRALQTNWGHWKVLSNGVDWFIG